MSSQPDPSSSSSSSVGPKSAHRSEAELRRGNRVRRKKGAAPQPKREAWGTNLAGAARVVHLFAAMAGFSVLLFFSVTGITLNHPEWFGQPVVRTKTETGQVELRWLGSADDAAATDEDVPATSTDVAADDSPTDTTDEVPEVDRLAIAEYLRATHRLRGTVSTFDVEPTGVAVTFLAPGYAARATIVRSTGRYEVAIDRHDFVSLLNDLHRGREGSTAWRVAIDVAGGLLVFTSLTGVWLLVHLKKRRAAGVITLIAGVAALLVAAWFAIP
ncbi:MAG TPA: PepSY-associated TM helix domain-containing protein [Pirellulaceae bacterium]|nr:PepSY-associated TM helix domain-containing protein [Pirellulaceae bacterium]